MGYLNKHRNVLDFTLSSLGRRKLKNFTLGVVYTFVVFQLASVLFFIQAIKKEAVLLLEGAPEMTVQRLEVGRQGTISTDYIEAIAGIRGVQSVSPRLWGYYFDSLTGANYTVMVNDDMAGRTGEAVVGSGVLVRRESGSEETRTVRKNDQLPFKTYGQDVVMLKVAGVLSTASALETADLVLVSEEDFRRIFQLREGLATDLVLRVRNPRELSTIAAKIVAAYPDTRPILRDDILRTYDGVFDWRGGLFIVATAGSLAAFMILVWDKATGLSADEKKEIGILKAIGWDTGDVLLMKFWEGAIISIGACLVGMILAYLHVFLGSSLLFEPVLKGWAVLYPDFRLTPYVDPYQLGVLLFLVVVPYTVASIIPSWRSATVDPDTIMRG